MLPAEERVTGHPAPGRQVLGGAGVARDEPEHLTGAQPAQAASQLEDQLAAPHVAGVPALVRDEPGSIRHRPLPFVPCSSRIAGNARGKSRSRSERGIVETDGAIAAPGGRRYHRSAVAPEFDLSDPDAVAFCPSCGSGYTARATRCAPCDVDLVPRGEIEAAAARTPAPDTETDADGEETVPLCRIDDPTKANLLGAELEQDGVPFWLRLAPLDPFGLPGFTEFRVPARYIEQARSVLRRVEESAQNE